ncbi:MAG: hypothetical protein ACPGJS_02170 [Flammeovirgaceae bacterium]
MEKAKKTGARILAAYFFMLPFLFALHGLAHEHHMHEHAQVEAILVQDVTDCVLCELYHNQVAVTQTAVTACIETPTTTIQYHFLPDVVNVFILFPTLRSPPIA